jgi:hypothetical protein
VLPLGFYKRAILRKGEAMRNAVTAKDPRKHFIMKMMKQKYGADKITRLREVIPDVFEGRCLKYLDNGNFEFMRVGKMAAFEMGVS